eukprot:gb/GFBE01061623.1/.p1 GENE.gb/GFBE01061623.1/~~gb/GFBE01061623.1/.p1  ORF type:complete len:191 (+),score=26.28 gb/GFBE01061623.1/:1-573(+)
MLQAAERPITLRHCLTHTTGLTYGGMLGQTSLTDFAMDEKGVAFTSMLTPGWVDTWVRDVGSLEEHCNILATIPLKSSPGTAFEYSASHLLVARVIEVVSGMSLKAFMQQEVLDPWAVRHHAAGCQRASPISCHSIFSIPSSCPLLWSRPRSRLKPLAVCTSQTPSANLMLQCLLMRRWLALLLTCCDWH